ncbi:MAG: hypothetical protein MUC32_10530, partial [Burkholderiaceae bacterium]|nr:hypothetical protein [Burkholderiaceae bacterium]
MTSNLDRPQRALDALHRLLHRGIVIDVHGEHRNGQPLGGGGACEFGRRRRVAHGGSHLVAGAREGQCGGKADASAG